MTWKLIDTETGEVLLDHVSIANNYFTRLAGLQFRPPLPPRHGLLMVPGSSIHTFCVRFAIDVINLDMEGRILKAHRQIRPWRVCGAAPGTHAVLETTALLATQQSPLFQEGFHVALCPPEDLRRIPRSLRFMTAADQGQPESASVPR